MARLILSQAGEDVDVGGDVTVFGTASGGEVITVLRGSIILDPSFNLGGDTLRLADDAQYFTMRMSGSIAILQGLGITISIPVGSAGIEVAFNDVTRTLRVDSQAGIVKLGDQNLGVAPVSVIPVGGFPSLVGSEAPDVITGTAGNDIIDALGGADRIDGGSGNDILRGGIGDDELSGSFGNDQLFGGPGNDRLTDDAGSSNSLDGGTGNDWLSVENYTIGAFDLSGGDGDDYIELSVGASGSCTIDAGAGADRVVIATAGIPIGLALGTGRDQLVLPAYGLDEAKLGVITVSDFEAGPLGDTIEFNFALSTYLVGWSQNSDPFSAGFLRLVDRVGGAVLQIDRDGAASGAFGFQDLIVFTGDPKSSFAKENFEGYAPSGGTQAGETGEDIGVLPGHLNINWPAGHFLA